MDHNKIRRMSENMYIIAADDNPTFDELVAATMAILSFAVSNTALAYEGTEGNKMGCCETAIIHIEESLKAYMDISREHVRANV